LIGASPPTSLFGRWPDRFSTKARPDAVAQHHDHCAEGRPGADQPSDEVYDRPGMHNNNTKQKCLVVAIVLSSLLADDAAIIIANRQCCNAIGFAFVNTRRVGI
jgi:hypothetical protein